MWNPNNEWLLTNGIGGYASSTIIGANTRHYHGLLIASLEPPINRLVTVAGVLEKVAVNSNVFHLNAHSYSQDELYEGSSLLQNFEYKEFPEWTYGNENWCLKKGIKMVQGHNAVLLHYKNIGALAFKLELHPLLSYSFYHATFNEQAVFDFKTTLTKNGFSSIPKENAHPIISKWTKGTFNSESSWHKYVHLATSKERGSAFESDYYNLGKLEIYLEPGETVMMGFSNDLDIFNIPLEVLWKKTGIKKENKAYTTFYKDLLNAGKQFVVERESTKSKTIIAGYHWFTDWGRDTMISMRGLTISTDQKANSKSILSTFFKYLDKGMLPDRFPDCSQEPIDYSSVDAALWLFVATHEYYKKFNDIKFVKKYLQQLEGILDWHIKGTRYNIKVTQEGFLFAAQEGVQLTWMDAMVNGKVITPRMGCPVEINALWYNALKIYEFFCKELNVDFKNEYADILEKFEKHFAEYFINTEGTLFDVLVVNGISDNSFRPNQIYWLSLPYTLLQEQQQKIIYEAVRKKLYTPYGLRTLSPDDANFKAVYEGDQWSRDHAYHEGTVWPFLIYEYYHAYFKLYGQNKANRLQVVKELQGLKEHFYWGEGIHCISEVFDGLQPKEGKGCIQQAWSVAAILKLYTDYKLYELDS